MTSYDLKTPVKIPPDIDETYVLTPSPIISSSPSPMQISAKTARRIAQKDEQFDLNNASPKPRSKSHLIMSPLEIQKKQNKERSITNLATILSLQFWFKNL